MIKALHLDDRLIHGQVAIAWTRALDVNVLFVVNDQIVNDQSRRNALKLGVPAGVKFGFRNVEDGIAFLNDPKNASLRFMVLINNTHDALRICQGIPSIKKISVGGIRKKDPLLLPDMNLNADDVADLKQLVELGVTLGYQPTPDQPFKVLNEAINKL